MRSVMVVEDDEIFRDAAVEVLTAAGYRVRVAHDGADAFAVLARGPLPDAILLDLGMPHMSGWQFRELQKRHGALRHIPVVVMTGGDPLGVEAAAVLQKPFEMDALAATSERVLGREPPGSRRAEPVWTPLPRLP